MALTVEFDLLTKKEPLGFLKNNIEKSFHVKNVELRFKVTSTSPLFSQLVKYAKSKSGISYICFDPTL
jgi:hypothetical protein